jgi:succinate dehydrogenase/fumarate reductase flavoprotein subunit
MKAGGWMARSAAYDVVVVGSGIAGLSAALAAKEMGLKPLLLEKGKKLGGGSAVAYGGIWVGMNHIGEAAGHRDSRDAVLSYMRFVGGDQIVEENLLSFVDHSPRAIRFFERCGVRFRLTNNLVDHYYPSAPGATAIGRSIEPDLISANELGEWKDAIFLPPNTPHELTVEEVIAWGGITNEAGWNAEIVADRRQRRVRGRGVALVTHFVKQLLARGVEIKCGVEVKKLVTTAGRVAGVETAAGERIAARRGVVLATGAYESSAALAATYEGLPGWQSMYPSTITGDGLVMGTELGAAVKIIHNNMALFLGFTIPPDRPGDRGFLRLVGISEMLCPHTIVVNRQGRRFADEAYFQGIAPRLREYVPATHQYANLPCFLIFDSQYQRAFSFAGRAKGAAIPDWVARGETLSELATALGVDAAGLEQTAARFNGFARTGVDEDFRRGAVQWTLAEGNWGEKDGKKIYANPRLGEIKEGPFYGIELHPSAFASAGLLTNKHAQVKHQRGHVIPGLYAAGNASAHVEYGVGYQAGYSLASGMTFGYLAARHMKSAAATSGKSASGKSASGKPKRRKAA